jgi:hypothetical protein
MAQAARASSTRAPDLSPHPATSTAVVLDFARRIPAPIADRERAFQAYKAKILADCKLMDRCLKAAAQELIAEIEATKAANGGVYPHRSRLPVSDAQFDADLAREERWPR